MSEPVSHRGLRAALAPIGRAIAMMAARSVVKLVDDTKGRQTLQAEILDGELRDGVERVQEYGFTSHPFADADAIILSLSGTREKAIAIAVDDRRYRLKLQEGEVALFDDLGNAVKLLRDKVHVVGVQEVRVEAPSVKVESTTVTIDASTLTVNANTTFNGSVTANGKRIDDTHKHSGVSTGSGTSGTPI